MLLFASSPLQSRHRSLSVLSKLMSFFLSQCTPKRHYISDQNPEQKKKKNNSEKEIHELQVIAAYAM